MSRVARHFNCWGLNLGRAGDSRMVGTKIGASNGSRPKAMNQTIQQKRAFLACVPRRISALSAFDGSVVDYRGDHGYGELGFDSGEGA